MLPTRLAPLTRLVATAAVLGGLAACAAAPPPEAAAPAPAAAGQDAGHGAGHGDAAPEGAGHGSGHGSGAVGLYAVQSGPLGVVTTDADGHLLYRHDADTPTASACTDACAQTWLPLVVPEGTEPDLLGVDPEIVGLLDRPEGRQVTLAGWPLYRRADDTGELTDAGAHGTDGVWFAVTPDGEKVAIA